MADIRPKSGERYRNTQDQPYQIVTIAKHFETGEELVIYQELYGNFEVCARPLSAFLEEKLPQEETECGGEQADPRLLRFIEAETYEEKYKMLLSLENTITERLINDFAVILDVVIPEGELSKRYEQLKQCVATMARYETTRLR